MRLKAPELYKWILLKWKFPPIPEMSLAVRPGLVGLRQLGMWTGTKTELSKSLRSTHPTQGCPHASSTPLPCSGPQDAQRPSQSSHSFMPSHFLPQLLCASYTPAHLTLPPTCVHTAFSLFIASHLPPSTSHTHTYSHLTFPPPPTVSSQCAFTPHSSFPSYVWSYTTAPSTLSPA